MPPSLNSQEHFSCDHHQWNELLKNVKLIDFSVFRAKLCEQKQSLKHFKCLHKKTPQRILHTKIYLNFKASTFYRTYQQHNKLIHSYSFYVELTATSLQMSLMLLLLFVQNVTLFQS